MFEFLSSANTNVDILKNIGNKTFMGHHWLEGKILCKSKGPNNCLVTDILQNIFLCVQRKRKPHTGLEL